MSSKLKPIQPTTIESVKRRFGIIGNDPSLNHAIEMALRVAPTEMNVLITGESGSGKESFSKIIHHYSHQKHGKLIVVNCGALPEGTIDSELFGHEKGAFTGAHETRKGYFQEAHEGTIFLDEIGDMPLATQARLLRVLEYGEYLKVGSSKVEKTHVRIIAATHVDLRAAVADGRFREDLYYRLNTVSLRIPPLRERRHDIVHLFKKCAIDFTDQYGGEPLQLTQDAVQVLITYPFPGNIRELKNLVVRMSVLECEHPTITAEKLTTYLPNAQHRLSAPPSNLPEPDRMLSERDILYKVLFDMQRDLVQLKKIIHQHTTPDVSPTSPPHKIPLLLDPFTATDDHSPTSLPALPSEKHTGTPTLTQPTSQDKAPTPLQEEPPIVPLEEMEKKAIVQALKQYNNSKRKAARALHIPERTLYRKIKKHNLPH